MAGEETNFNDGQTVDPVAGKTVSEILGEITWLMTQDKSAREMPVKDIERLVMPAILLRQFHIEYAIAPIGRSASGETIYSPESGKQPLQPVSVEIFAMCSDAVAAALEANPDISLALQDWRSGKIKRTICHYDNRKRN